GSVHGAVAAALGVAGAAELAVGHGGLVVAADVVAVEAVPVPHGVGVVLPRLPAHRVDLLHGGVLEVAAPALPAAVVAGGGIDDRAVRRGAAGQGQGEKGHRGGEQREDAPRLSAGSGVGHR